ncbi:MAG: hypothetical protein OTI35_09630 [Sulfitobacter sp.]|nr:hypothetical protein [Sulfitobacter sp.]
MEKFYTHLETQGRSPDQVTAADFEGLTSSRTSHRVLMHALRQFAPEVPLAAARLVSKKWDHWLNANYNPKVKRPRPSRRVALAPETWPQAWRSVIPSLDQVVRVDGRRFRPLAPKTRENVLQAVGMLGVAKAWGQQRGVALDESFSPDLIEAFNRFMLLEREVSTRTVADYLERIRAFGERGHLLRPNARLALADLIGALREDAADQEPGKRVKLRAFRTKFTLTDLLTRALVLATEADAAPDGTGQAERKRRIALIFALLVNTGDRQGDLSQVTIGEQVTRGEDGLWLIRIRQAKTRRWKDLGPLWPVTSALIDAHVLAGRPAWQIEECVSALNGCNLLSLNVMPFHSYYATSVLREEFGISGHLVRTLITDLLRNARPDAAWAAQEILGHSNRWMQATYQSDFRATASVRQWHEVLKMQRERNRVE